MKGLKEKYLIEDPDGFWRVLVFKTKKDMRRWCNKKEVPLEKRNLACTIRTNDLSNKLKGEILFYKASSKSLNVVAHEATHMAKHQLTREGKNLENENEERLATMVGCYTSQIFYHGSKKVDRVKRIILEQKNPSVL